MSLCQYLILTTANIMSRLLDPPLQEKMIVPLLSHYNQQTSVTVRGEDFFPLASTSVTEDTRYQLAVSPVQFWHCLSEKIPWIEDLVPLPFRWQPPVPGCFISVSDESTISPLSLFRQVTKARETLMLTHLLERMLQKIRMKRCLSQNIRDWTEKLHDLSGYATLWEPPGVQLSGMKLCPLGL